MFIGLGGLEGQVPLEWLTHSLVIRMQNMHQISSKFWKGQTSECPLKFVIWALEVVVVGWEDSDAGVLVLVAAMGAVVDVMIQIMVEGEDGDLHLPHPAGQIRVVAVGMTLGTGTWDILAVDAFKSYQF